MRLFSSLAVCCFKSPLYPEDRAIDGCNSRTPIRPYGKQVVKGHARLLYTDFRNNPENPAFSAVPQELATLDLEKSLSDKNVEKAMIGAAKVSPLLLEFLLRPSSAIAGLIRTGGHLQIPFAKHVEPSMDTVRRLGNLYTGSLFAALASLLCNVSSEQLVSLHPSSLSRSTHTDLLDLSKQLGKRLGFYAYGSGAAASFYTAKVVGSTQFLADAVNLEQRLQSMKIVTPQEFVDAINVCPAPSCSASFLASRLTCPSPFLDPRVNPQRRFLQARRIDRQPLAGGLLPLRDRLDVASEVRRGHRRSFVVIPLAIFVSALYIFPTHTPPRRSI